MHASNVEYYRSVNTIGFGNGPNARYPKKRFWNAVAFWHPFRFTVTNDSPGDNTVNPVFPVGADGVSNDARTFRNIPRGAVIGGVDWHDFDRMEVSWP